ncbi:MAG: hypothetical protein PHE29_09780 [Tissierellia bacterium]|nr:hypothetical protein [Tissierellia bacterium]
MSYGRYQNIIQLLNSNQRESVFMKLMKEYLERNPKIGYIVFQVYQESPIKGRIPIDNAMVTVNKYLGNGYFVSKVLYTDSDGKTVPLPFFTPDKKFSMTPGNDHVYETYIAYIGAPDFKTAYVSDIQVFDGITSIQSVILLPE